MERTTISRVVVVGLLLLAMAFLAIKYLLQGGDPRPPGSQPKPAVEAVEGGSEN